MKYLYITLFILISNISNAQFVQDYFINPVKIPLVLSGTFGELRSNHFHSGLDIKTQQKVGIEIHAAASGYVSRIKISNYGYGKALYIQHPNGYTSVYAHLQKFSPKIEAYVKKQQYKKERYTIELFPSAEVLPVTQDEIVAYSGNSGGSSGPHLHFEIRNGKQEPMNPMLFGIDIKDTRKPAVNNVWLYPLDEHSHINGKNVPYRLQLLNNAKRISKKVTACGRIGIGVNTYDKQDAAYNKNGYYAISTTLNGNPNFKISMDRFSFSETRYINQLIDYKYFRKNRSRITKLFVDHNNPLSVHHVKTEGNGILEINDGFTYNSKIYIEDVKGNTTTIEVPIEGKLTTIALEKEIISEKHYYATPESAFNYANAFATINFPKGSVYEPTYLCIEDLENRTIKIHDNTTPLHKYMHLSFSLDSVLRPKKTFIGRFNIGTPKKGIFAGNKIKDGRITLKTRTFGNYGLFEDTDKPKAVPINFANEKWISSLKTLKVKVSDATTGIKYYRATINGKFALMAFSPKTGLLTYDFEDGISNSGRNEFKLVVEDHVGNNTIFESVFYRK